MNRCGPMFASAYWLRSSAANLGYPSFFTASTSADHQSLGDSMYGSTTCEFAGRCPDGRTAPSTDVGRDMCGLAGMRPHYSMRRARRGSLSAVPEAGPRRTWTLGRSFQLLPNEVRFIPSWEHEALLGHASRSGRHSLCGVLWRSRT